MVAQLAASQAEAEHEKLYHEKMSLLSLQATLDGNGNIGLIIPLALLLVEKLDAKGHCLRASTIRGEHRFYSNIIIN